MISKDSPLRRYPINLAAEQILFFDGVRYSFEGVDSAYERLIDTLADLAMQRAVDTDIAMTSALLASWTIIDNIDRLRTLVLNPPKMGKTRPSEIESFLAATLTVRHLRNHAQHLLGKLSKLAKLGDPIWGVLSWVTWEGEACHAGSLRAGTVFPTPQFRGILPSGRNDAPIILEAVGESVRLDQCVSATRTMIRWLEGFLHGHFARSAPLVPRTTPDVLITLELNVAELEKEWRRATPETPGAERSNNG
jgi:hypothetical protein